MNDLAGGEEKSNGFREDTFLKDLENFKLIWNQESDVKYLPAETKTPKDTKTKHETSNKSAVAAAHACCVFYPWFEITRNSGHAS